MRDGYADFDVDVDDGNQAYFVNIRLVGWKHIFFSVLKIGRVFKKHSYVQRLVKIHFLQEKQYSVSKTSLLGHGKVSLCKNILGKRIFALSRENFEIRIVFSTPRQKSRAEFQIEVKTATKYLLCPLLAKLAHLPSHLKYDTLADVAGRWNVSFPLVFGPPP